MDKKNELRQLSQLAVFDGMMEADIIKSKLESFGIPCMLKFEPVGRVLGITTDGLGKVQVMVPTEYLEKAMEIIRTDESSSDQNDDDDDDYDDDDDDDDDEDDVKKR